MSSTVRNVNKNQIVAEDMAIGVGKVPQTRGGKSVEGTRVNIPQPVFSIEEMQNWSPLVSNRVLLEISSDDYAPYIFDVNATVGIQSNVTSPGVWVLQKAASDVVLVPVAESAVTIGGDNHNQMLQMQSTAGAVLTVGRSVRNIGGSEVVVVPTVIFVTSETDSSVSLAAEAGVELQTPRIPQLYRKYSTMALISVDEHTWRLVGDLEV